MLLEYIRFLKEPLLKVASCSALYTKVDHPTALAKGPRFSESLKAYINGFIFQPLFNASQLASMR